jgi:ribonuclease E
MSDMPTRNFLPATSRPPQLRARGEAEYDREHPSAPQAAEAEAGAVEAGATDDRYVEPPVSATAGSDATMEWSASEAPVEPSAAEAGPGSTLAPAESDAAPEAPVPPDATESAVPSERVPEPVPDDRPKRSGWWNRKSFF